MKKFLILLLFSVNAYALEELSISWNPPMSRVDGTPLTIEEISHYELYMDDVLLTDSIQGTETSYIISVSTGSKCFKMKTVDIYSRSSPFSNVLCKDIVSAPGAPLSITIDYVGN